MFRRAIHSLIAIRIDNPRNGQWVALRSALPASSPEGHASWYRADQPFDAPTEPYLLRGRDIMPRSQRRSQWDVEGAPCSAGEGGRGFRVRMHRGHVVGDGLGAWQGLVPLGGSHTCCDRARQREDDAPAAYAAEMQQRGGHLESRNRRRYREQQHDRDPQVA